jgi:succinoglycan biosynthesis transport protein ExoP
MEKDTGRKGPDISFRTSDLGFYIRKMKWLVIFLAGLFAFSAYAFAVVSYKPYYYATTSLIVNSRDTGSPEADRRPTLDDFTLARTLVPTYTLVLQSNRVMNYVREELGLDIPTSVLRSFVSLQAVEDTQVLYLNVTCPDRQMAVDISKAIVRVAPKAFMDTVEIGSVRVIDTAFAVGTVPRNAKIKTAVGGGIGLVCGIVIIFIYGMLSGKIISAKDLESSLGVPVLGEIEYVRKKRSGGLLISSPFIPKSCIEAYMTLGAITDRLLRDKGIKKLLISSAVKGEGRTNTAINLAIALANAGRSVLLMDCDLRNPKIAEILGLQHGDAAVFHGIESGHGEAFECVIEVRPGLHVIPFVSQFDRSHSLFRSVGFGRSIELYSSRYDYILYDSPPLYPVTDALYLAEHADGVLMVVRQDKASVKTIYDCVMKLGFLDAGIIGCVLNGKKYARIRSPYTRQYAYYRDFISSADNRVPT